MWAGFGWLWAKKRKQTEWRREPLPLESELTASALLEAALLKSALQEFELQESVRPLWARQPSWAAPPEPPGWRSHDWMKQAACWTVKIRWKK